SENSIRHLIRAGGRIGASFDVMLAILRTLAIFVGDLLKSRGRLLAENLFLRYQLIIARRRALSRPRLYGSERALLVWMTRVGALYASSIMSALGQKRTFRSAIALSDPRKRKTNVGYGP